MLTNKNLNKKIFFLISIYFMKNILLIPVYFLIRDRLLLVTCKALKKIYFILFFLKKRIK